MKGSLWGFHEEISSNPPWPIMPAMGLNSWAPAAQAWLAKLPENIRKQKHPKDVPQSFCFSASPIWDKQSAVASPKEGSNCTVFPQGKRQTQALEAFAGRVQRRIKQAFLGGSVRRQQCLRGDHGSATGAV